VFERERTHDFFRVLRGIAGMSTDTQTPVQRDASLLPLDYAAILLAAITGVIHLYEGYEDFDEGLLAILFLLAGIGFFVWILLLVLRIRPRLLYLGGFVFTAIQFVAYFVLRWPEIYETLGLVDKAVQLLLMIALAVLFSRTS